MYVQQRNAAMIKTVQEVGSIITDAKPITESADAVTTYTEEFLKDVRSVVVCLCKLVWFGCVWFGRACV